jgi:hypothetical protein
LCQRLFQAFSVTQCDIFAVFEEIPAKTTAYFVSFLSYLIETKNAGIKIPAFFNIMLWKITSYQQV